MKIILNHKSNLTYKEIINYYKEYKELDTKHDLIVCPTTCYLPIFKDVVLGSQDISPYKMGSYTGEVSGEALKSLGVKYVFINHSERRHLNNEPLELAKEKLIRAKEADLIPILCVGEEDGEDAVEVLTHDLNYLLKDLNIDNLYISYEPCYAIGSGNIPSREKLVTVFNYLKEKYNYEDTVTFVNAYLDKDYYSNDIPLSKDKASKLDVIVNKYYKLDKDYEPEDLTIINSKFASGTQKLRKEAADKFEEMASDMLKENLKIYAGSTYRSYSYQEGLYNRYVKKDGFKEAETYSARAGYSEHQLGLAVDIVNGKWNYLSEGDKEYTWLINNSYKYGFILRYPHESEYITGYVFEDWHFRYLGIDLATKVYESKLTYDEYIARGMLKEK